MQRILTAMLALLGCGNVTQRPFDVDASLDSAPAIDAPSALRCDRSALFGAPTLIANLSTSNDEMSFSMTRDELLAFIGAVVQPPVSSARILVAERRIATDEFSAPGAGPAAPIDLAGEETAPASVADGLLLYFQRQRMANIDILVASRTDRTAAYSPEAQVTVDGTGLSPALGPEISDDGQTLYWIDYADFKVHSAVRGAAPSQFVGRVVASTMDVGSAVVSADELTLYYSNGNADDVLVSKRADRKLPFNPGVPVDGVNSPQKDYPVHLTHDGCVLVLASTRPGGLGGFDLWEARRPM